MAERKQLAQVAGRTTTVSSPAHAVRITLPYEDCKHVISMWAERSQRVIVYQHDADEKISNTHIHLALYGCEVKAEALKRMWIDCPGKGNEFWSWKDYDEGTNYLTYMSKGHLAPVFVKNISEQQVEESRLAWVEPDKADKPSKSSEPIIYKIMSRFKINDLRRFHIGEDEIEFGQCKYNLPLLSDCVRTESFKILWGEKRMAPHASHYKIIAATVFLRICEDANCFEAGVSHMKNLWY